MLDALEQKRVNIKDLILEAPTQPEVFDTFDVKKDITRHDWEVMSHYLSVKGNHGNSALRRYYFKLASFVKVLDQDRYENLTKEKTAELQRDMRWDLFSQFTSLSQPPSTAPIRVDELIEAVSQAKILFPEQLSDLYQENAAQWGEKYPILVKQSQSDLQSIIPIKWGMFTIAFKGLEDLPFKESDADPYIAQFLKDHRPRKWHESVTSEPQQMAGFLAGLRISFPNRFEEIKLTQDDWEYMRAEMDVLRSKDNFTKGFRAHPQYFAQHAYHLYILAAKDVQVTEKGLEVVPTTNQVILPPNTAPLPTQRRF